MRSVSRVFIFVVFVFCSVICIQNRAEAGLILQSEDEIQTVLPLTAFDVVDFDIYASCPKSTLADIQNALGVNCSIDIFQRSPISTASYSNYSFLRDCLIEINSIPASPQVSGSFSVLMLSVDW